MFALGGITARGGALSVQWYRCGRCGRCWCLGATYGVEVRRRQGGVLMRCCLLRFNVRRIAGFCAGCKFIELLYSTTINPTWKISKIPRNTTLTAY